MRNRYSAYLAAALGLALAFTFSCSSDSDDGDKINNSGNSSSLGGSGNRSSSSNGGTGNSSSSGTTAPSSPSGGDADCVVKTPFHKGICPTGYHIPTKNEWDALVATADGSPREVAKKLKAINGWYSWNGTDNYGFAALPGGYCLSDGTCKGTGSSARWWSASEDNATYAYGRSIIGDDGIALVDDNKSDFLSVRCLQDYASGNGGGNPETWGTINLNYDVEGSRCYNNTPENCAKHGRLYNWAAAMALPQKCNSTVSGGSNPTQPSSSSGGTQGGLGSCTFQTPIQCEENISQDLCLAEGGTFSSAACSASYTYCLSLNNPISCNLIGSTSTPSKASCPANENGIKVFTDETLCSGSKGACILQLLESDASYKGCLDVNRGICEQFYAPASADATFQTGECGTTAEQYPCCFIPDEETVVWFISSFSKSNCYSRGGMLANASLCLAVDPL